MAAEQDPLEERKSRLKALRLAADLSEAPETGDEDGEGGMEAEAEDEESDVNIKFRNYVPRDEQLQQLKVLPPQPPKFDDPLAKAPEDTNGTEDPLVSIAPKKANWDLRRDVAKKLEKLERRTQRAIIQLMQEEEKRRQADAEGVEDEMEGLHPLAVRPPVQTGVTRRWQLFVSYIRKQRATLTERLHAWDSLPVELMKNVETYVPTDPVVLVGELQVHSGVADIATNLRSRHV